jgi:putative glutamine amidotransferase
MSSSPSLRNAPLILISPGTDRRGTEFADASMSLSNRYGLAVTTVGGVPWVLPCSADEGVIEEVVARCNGVLLSGGDDIQPELYLDAVPGALRRTVKTVDPVRDVHELLLIREVFRQRKPLFAICRGHQLLNVALGGTLLVDIARQRPDAIKHNCMDRKDQPVHKAALTPDSLLAKMTGKRVLAVNSTHHQAVDRVAVVLEVTAKGPDGVVESLELSESERGMLPYLLAVQFHPERLYERHPEFLELFRGLILACKRKC